MNKGSMLRSACALAAACSAPPAGAAGFKAGEWDLTLGGIANGYYTHSSCSGNQTFTGSGLALASQGLGCAGAAKSTIVGNGLLPNALVATAATKQAGWDIGATFLMGVAVSSGDSISNNNNVDVRQSFFTVGKADVGTFKIGRDAGLYGNDAIFSDMTLVGTGATVAATQRNRVTLGHIGAGYTYLGYYGQIAYTTPSFGGLNATVAVMSPVDAFTGVATAGDTPQLQARLKYSAAGLDVWAGLKSQKFLTTGPSFTMNGAELGGSYTAGPFGVLANVQSGRGIGVLADADSGNLKQTNALLQGTFQVTSDLKLGLGWGQSKIKDGSTTDLKDNTNITGGAYYKLTPSATVVGELSNTRSKTFDGAKARMNGISAGAILFF